MADLTDEEMRDMDLKTAILAMAKGSQLPAYMASLPITDRLIIVRALNAFDSAAMSEQLKTILIAYPEVFAQVIDQSLAAKMDALAVLAKAELAKWSPEELVEDLARIIRKVHNHPSQNARYN